MKNNRTTTPDRSRRPSPRAVSPLKADKITAANIRSDDYAPEILLAVLAEIETLPVLGNELKEGATPELLQIRELGIAYRPAQWHGIRLDCAQRQAYSRAAMRLENAGLLLRISEPKRDRVTHLQLTAGGLRLALRLAGRRADRSAVAEGLLLTSWGRELAAGIRGKARRDSSVPKPRE